MKIERLFTDILIIGGGTAGCFAALTISKNSNHNVLILEKANIKRSGCLAAGVNALNAYIIKGNKPEDYVNYAKWDADNIVRYDLLLTMSNKLNWATKQLEDLGLVILKDGNGEYLTRNNRNIKINGENIKPLLAKSISNNPKIKIQNNTYAIDYIVKDNKIVGAYALSVTDEILYVIEAKAVLCATGGASGLYKSNNPGFSRHKMWYPPFNTGAGYAMGIRAGSEMTTFEMRFIALRCKDTIAPTGTLAGGLGAPQINSLGEDYSFKYGNRTSERVYGTVQENLIGNGPCYLKTEGINEKEVENLEKAYLNMAPSQTLKWVQGNGPAYENVEIEGTEPYVIGGHTASGYWIDTKRATTIKGLYAAGDVAGGCPQKYVTGALVEGDIAATSIIDYLKDYKEYSIDEEDIIKKAKEVESLLGENKSVYSIEDLEEAMQTVMDKYAGGISTNYSYNENSLKIAKEKILSIIDLSNKVKAKNMRELLSLNELKDRLDVCIVLIEHLKARKETRWHSFAENASYPNKSDDFLKYVNSKVVDNKVNIIIRDLVTRGDVYEHSN